MTRPPTPVEYQTALQRPALAFTDPVLAAGQVRVNQLGPAGSAGNFAVTYQVATADGPRAVRCFYRLPPQLARRYMAICSAIQTLRLPALLWCRFQPTGIRVGDGSHPLVTMPWADGVEITELVTDDRRPETVRRLREAFRAVLAQLGAAGIAHGDLQHGNLLVRPDNTIVLIDYDGMWVPELAPTATPAADQGHRNYQHPRRGDRFDEGLDGFSAIVIDLALAAIECRPSLVDRFGCEDGLLFTAADLADPHGSALLRTLLADPQLGVAAARFMKLCLGDGADVPSLRRFWSSTPGGSAAPGERYVPAQARTILISLEGRRATVVGKPYKVHVGRNGAGKPFAFLNFGHRREGCLTVKMWGERPGPSLPLHPDMVTRLPNHWMSITGAVTVHDQPGRPPNPEIEMRFVDQMRLLTAEQAWAMLDDSRFGAGPAPGATDAHALSRLYRSLVP